MAITDPNDFASTQVWLDAQTLGLADNGDVDSWTDLSGNGNHFTDVAGAVPNPIFKTAIYNGHPIVRFNGTDQILYDATLALSQPITIGMVVAHRSGSVASNEGFISGADDSPLIYAMEAGTDVYAIYAGSAAVPSSVSLNTSFRNIVAVFNGASSLIRVDGTETTGNPGAAGTTSTMSLGAGLDLGLGGIQYADIDIGEVVICDAALSAGDITDLEAYFTAHWAAAGSVISPEHYYRNLLAGQSL